MIGENKVWEVYQEEATLPTERTVPISSGANRHWSACEPRYAFSHPSLRHTCTGACVNPHVYIDQWQVLQHPTLHANWCLVAQRLFSSLGFNKLDTSHLMHESTACAASLLTIRNHVGHVSNG